MFALRQDRPAGYTLRRQEASGYTLRLDVPAQGYRLSQGEIGDYWDIGVKLNASASSQVAASVQRVRALVVEMEANSEAVADASRFRTLMAAVAGLSGVEVGGLNGRYVLAIDPDAASSVSSELARVVHERVDVSATSAVDFNLYVSTVEALTIDSESVVDTRIERVRGVAVQCAADSVVSVIAALVRVLNASPVANSGMDAILSRVMEIAGEGVSSAGVVDAGALMRVRAMEAAPVADGYAHMGLGTWLLCDSNGELVMSNDGKRIEIS